MKYFVLKIYLTLTSFTKKYRDDTHVIYYNIGETNQIRIEE